MFNETEEAEQALLALANPITWEWREDLTLGAGWAGKSDGIYYQIVAPRSPGDVDAVPTRRCWLIRQEPGGYDFHGYALSLEKAKQICLDHAVFGTHPDWAILNDASWHEDQAFLAAAKAARFAFYPHFLPGNPPRLHWESSALDQERLSAAKFHGSYAKHFDRVHGWTVTRREQGRIEDKYRYLSRATAKRCAHYAREMRSVGEQGIYTIHFSSASRWIVGFSSWDTSVEQHQFLTKAIAKQACALHNRVGEWHGTLLRQL